MASGHHLDRRWNIIECHHVVPAAYLAAHGLGPTATTRKFCFGSEKSSSRSMPYSKGAVSCFADKRAVFCSLLLRCWGRWSEGHSSAFVAKTEQPCQNSCNRLNIDTRNLINAKLPFEFILQAKEWDNGVVVSRMWLTMLGSQLVQLPWNTSSTTKLNPKCSKLSLYMNCNKKNSLRALCKTKDCIVSRAATVLMEELLTSRELEVSLHDQYSSEALQMHKIRWSRPHKCLDLILQRRKKALRDVRLPSYIGVMAMPVCQGIRNPGCKSDLSCTGFKLWYGEDKIVKVILALLCKTKYHAEVAVQGHFSNSRWGAGSDAKATQQTQPEKFELETHSMCAKPSKNQVAAHLQIEKLCLV